MKLCCALLVLFCANYVNSARILCLPVWPSYSHQVFYWPIWKELAKNGHDLVVLTTDPVDDAPPNIKQIDLHFAYDIRHSTHNITKTLQKNEYNPIKMVQTYEEVVMDVLDKELGHPEVQKLLKNETEHFDLVISEMMMYPMYYFSVRFNCPYIVVTSTDLPSSGHSFYGNPDHPVIYPNAFSAIGDRTSFTNRLKIFAVTVLLQFAYFVSPYGQRLQPVTKKYFGEDSPPLEQVLRNTSMIFINSHPVLSSQRPLGPGFVEIGGGTHIGEPQPLPKEIKTFLDNATEGAIYFSLGTNVLNNHIGSELTEIFVETFRELPYKVLWKFEEELEHVSNNVKIVKWAPQQDVLRHKNIKLMIFQCGLQSTEEVLLNEIPVVGIPFVSDQTKVGAFISNLDAGIILDKKTITKEKFKAALQEVITNPKFKQNAERVSLLLQDIPMTGLEKAVWWTEYVIRHKGTPHFWNKRVGIPFYQYYFLDTYAVALAILSLATYVLYRIVKFIIFCVIYGFKFLISRKQKQQ